jgi:uncharacterized membrane protein YeaQ/YmgE (transglycosylase-associated protein family)
MDPILWILSWLLLGYLGGKIAANKGYNRGFGVLIAVLLGPIALVGGVFLPKTFEGRAQAEVEADLNEEGRIYDRKKNCPNCARELSLMTSICPNCEHRFASK